MLKRLAVLGLFIIALISCNNNTEYKTFLHDPILFSKTVYELNTVVMGNNFPPMVASRNYAYAAIAAYEVMAANNTTKDNYLEARGAEKYTVTKEPGRWVPTPPMYASAAEHHWMEIRTMVIDSASIYDPVPPPVFNIKDKNSKYYQEVIAIKNAIDSLTPEQKHMAEFWDDNPFKMNVTGHVMFGSKKFSPPGHWMSVVGIAAKQAKSDYAETIYATTSTAIALFDAFIQCWYVKYKYNTVRPETVINQYIDINWRPYLQTPAFPEYTCGHSTISSAAAEALTSVYGDNFAYTDSTELEFGIANRSFKSFRHAADENNWARFYGGLHFHNSCIISTDIGQKVGKHIATKLKMKK